MSGRDGNVFDDEIASAPPRKLAPASSAMSAVAGVSLTHTGIVATSLTAIVTTEQSTLSLPTFEPMSTRSMCGEEKFSSSASTPSPWHARVSVCQWCSSLSVPEPAMIEATRTLPGYWRLMLDSLPTHQSSGLSEISSQFHDECSAAFGRFLIDSVYDSASARRNFVFGRRTLATGCSPIVLVTTPPQPASKARMMFASDSVGGADDSRNGLPNGMPVKTVDRSAMAPSFRCGSRNSVPAGRLRRRS